MAALHRIDGCPPEAEHLTKEVTVWITDLEAREIQLRAKVANVKPEVMHRRALGYGLKEIARRADAQDAQP